MKTATIPSVRVEPELRDQVESVLADGESLSQFVETSVRDSVRRRLTQAEFVKRGIASLEDARRSGKYVSVDALLAKLDKRLAAARAGKTRKTAAKG